IERLAGDDGVTSGLDPAVRWLQHDCGLDRRGAEQAVAYILAGRAVLGVVPTQATIVAERFFDEGGGMHLVLHTPFGGRLNRAWGLALRKRFCATFDFELQAAATDEGIVLSLGERHSFPLESVFGFLRAETVREVLIQAILQAPMFLTRWRWNAQRSLALLRFSGGKKVPPQIQRMRAEDLLAAVFPAATACQENIQGPRQVPDHPLVRETIRDCLIEAMDIEGLEALLRRIESGEVRCLARDTPAPSPFCHEILNANPYAFLDDAPLEERRARAVEMRRSLSPDLAGNLGALSADAIVEVEEEAWPVVRSPDELHDALLTLYWVPEREAQPWAGFLPTLIESGRAVAVQASADGGVRGWVATERIALVRSALPDVRLAMGRTIEEGGPERDEAIQTIVQGWMESTGPTTASELAAKLGFPPAAVEGALLRLEASGQVLRGTFRPASVQHSGAVAPKWCDRRLLARIHRLTIGMLRKDIEPVTVAEFMKFLFQWQHVAPGSRLHGEAGLMEVVRQLAGFEAAASAWERFLLPCRLSKYDPDWLDRLCLGGVASWGRLSPHPRLDEQPLGLGEAQRTRRVMPTSVAPIGLFPREEAGWLLRASGEESGSAIGTGLGPVAQDLQRQLQQRGACFFADLVVGTGHLQTEVEEGLWELAAAGLVTADGFDNLRALLDPKRRRAEGRNKIRRPSRSAGRWYLLTQAVGVQPSAVSAVEQIARQLLRRYGVVFRDLLGRESLSPPWRDLLVHYRRLESRGDIRGGRFVAGFVGEQFALPEAVESLRALRRAGSATGGPEIKLSGADPLNLAGIILPGPRVPALPSNYVVFRDGVPIRSGSYPRAGGTMEAQSDRLVIALRLRD
ncbi:MAG: DEAD/DEAH box helicase, partial [Nitrospiraceae bacterium]